MSDVTQGKLSAYSDPNRRGPWVGVHILAVAILLLLAWLAYATTLDNSFVWDDHELVARNPDVRSGPVLRLFTTGAWAFQAPARSDPNNNYYRPLQIATYRMVDSISGLSPFAFHLTSLILHCLTTLLTYAVFYKLLRAPTAALAGACLFTVHPIHTEAIDWIACSADLGCALFLLLSFYCYLSARTAVSVVAFLAALLWKEMAATLPLLIAAHIIVINPASLDARANWKKIAVTTAPYWLFFVIYLGLRHNALGVFYAVSVNWTLSPLDLILTTFALLADYWWKLVLPLGLNAYHVFDLAHLGPVYFLKFGLLAAVMAFTIYAFKRQPLRAFASLWIFLTLLPVLNVYHLGSNIFGERYLYIPSIGFCLLAATLVGSRRLLPVSVALAIVSGLYVAQDWNRAHDWGDDFTLFSKTIQDSPRSALVNNIYGDLLRAQKNDLAQAEQHYRQAITLAESAKPPQLSQLSVSYLGLAHVFDETHQPAKALSALDEAQRVNPANSGVDLARAVILAEEGHWQNSKQTLQHILGKDPNNDVALNTMGMIAWQAEHNDDLAARYFQRALNAGAVGATAASVHNNLGAIYGGQRRYEQALAEFHLASELDPQNPEFIVNSGNVFGMTGRNTEAKAYFTRALEIQPGYPPALAGLANLNAAR